MLTRRSGAACETAQNSAEERQPDRPLTLIVRFDRERQKLSRAMQLLGVKHRLYTSTWPLMVTSVGEEAQASHLGVIAHLEVERDGSAAVGAWHEQQCIALRAHFAVNLLVGDGVDDCLDLTRRHARVEDDHVGSEVRRHRVNHDRSNREKATKKKPGGNLHVEGCICRELWGVRFRILNSVCLRNGIHKVE
jgi:hypothetical protein